MSQFRVVEGSQLVSDSGSDTQRVGFREFRREKSTKSMLGSAKNSLVFADKTGHRFGAPETM